MRRLYFLSCLWFICACAAPQAPVHKQLYAMGTLIDVSFYDSSDEQINQAMQAITDDFTYMSVAWNPWKAGTIARVNKLLPLQASFSSSASAAQLIAAAKPLAEQSENLFNPAMGQLIKLWRFNVADNISPPPPSDVAIKALINDMPTLADVEVKGLVLKGKHQNLLLDFGGFAKGYGVDKVIEHLQDLGVKNVIVNAGGDLRAIGSKGKKPWVVGIRHPRADGIIASVNIDQDESVFTSGDYERYYDYEDRRYHHILDPRSGHPAQGVTSVTVIHKNAATADAAATALFVAGVKDWHRIAMKMGIRYVMLIDDKGEVHMNPAMKARIKWQQSTQKIHLSPELG
ncbi:MAG: FAD:protein FMN transferase [Gammaproteobacteria bacterium]|nr:FAD:protein FMN transferase [Gammaproteobacteria bacterium]